MARIDKAQALAHVHRILDKVPLIDAHNDLPIIIRKQADCDVRAFDLTRAHQGYDTDIPRLKAGRLAAQWWAAFVPTRVKQPALYTLEQIDVALEIARAHPDVFLPATRSSDVARAKRDGKIASFVTVESGVGLENSLAPLRVWYAAGVRLMTLCHNETLDWVDSSTDAPRHGGLTAFGEQVVHEMNRLGMIVDCAHSSHEAQHKVLDVSRAPVVFSHMNAFSLCNHPRNVPDSVLARLKANGGIAMVTFVPAFISQPLRDWQRPLTDPFGKAPPDADRAGWNDSHARKVGPAPRATLEQLCDHIAHMVEHAGIDHIGRPRRRVEVPRPARRTRPPRLERCPHRQDRRPQLPARIPRRRAHGQVPAGDRGAARRPGRQRHLICSRVAIHHSSSASANAPAKVPIWRARRNVLRHLNWPRLAWKCSTTGSTPAASKIL
jgi:membrane dipeptidase